MTFDNIETFLDYFEGIRDRTLRVAEYIPRVRLEWAPAGDRFSFGDLIRHLGATERYMFAENARGEPSRYPGHDLAFLELVQEKDDGIRSWWNGLTVHQQNVLRAVAGSDDGLTTSRTLSRFSLPSSGSTANTAKALIEDGRLVRTDHGSGYVFDNPFVRGWVVQHTFPDLGMKVRWTYRASETAEYGTPDT